MDHHTKNIKTSLGYVCGGVIVNDVEVSALVSGLLIVMVVPDIEVTLPSPLPETTSEP